MVETPSNLTATYGQTLADVALSEGWAWEAEDTTPVGTVDGENRFWIIYTHPTEPDNYEQLEETVSITVRPKEVTAPSIIADSDFVFNGSAHRPAVLVKDGENTIPASEYTVSYIDNINAGTATILIQDNAEGNYTVSGQSSFVIAKAQSVQPAVVEREFLRTIATQGNVVDLEALLPDDHGTITYTIGRGNSAILQNVSVEADGKLVFDTNMAEEPTSGIITVKAEMQNYEDVTLTVVVTLSGKEELQIIGVSAAEGLRYSGKPQQGYTGAPRSKYTGNYEIFYTGRDNSYSSMLAPTNAGDYTVTFKIPESDLYYAGSLSLNFSIGKAPLTVIAEDKEARLRDEMPELTYTVIGLIGEDTIHVTLRCDADMDQAGEYPILVSAVDPEGNYEIETIDGTLTVSFRPFRPDSDKDDDADKTPSYRPDLEIGEGGSISLSDKTPEQGETVVITPKPEAGKEVESIIVTDSNGDPVKVTDRGDGTYSFKQPKGAVTIEVRFKGAGSTSECKRNSLCPLYPYGDVDRNAWYHDGLHYAVEEGLMQGMSSSSFAPNLATSRAMIVTILWRLEGCPVVNYAMGFEDVAVDAWYTEAIRWAASRGIVSGYSETAFGPNDSITREQMATILYRYAQYKGYELNGGSIQSYGDAALVSDWAKAAMEWACGSGLIQGSNNLLDPQGDATRAQSATILYRFCEMLDK